MPRSSDVFVQNKQPFYTYVNRSFVHPRTGESFDPELEIGKILSRGSTIVQVVGPTKSGKTVAIKSVFQEQKVVRVGGSQVSDPDRLWALVCADLRVQVSQKLSTNAKTAHTDKTAASAKAGIYAAEFGISSEKSLGQEKGTGKAIELLDNLYELATGALLNSEKTLFLDNFHLVHADQKRLVAATLKDASEKGVKICLAEIPPYADEPQEYLRDLVGRVVRVEFGYWRQADLLEIARKGFHTLRVSVPESAVTALAVEAGGSPQLMQLLCLELCDRFNINDTQDRMASLPVNLADLTMICIKTLDSIPSELPLLTLEVGSTTDRSYRPRWQTRKDSVDLYEACIAAIAMNPPRLELPIDTGTDSLVSRVHKLVISGHENITVDALCLTLEDIACTAGKLNLSLPFVHFDRIRGVTILDPYMLFYIRWSSKYFELRKTV